MSKSQFNIQEWIGLDFSFICFFLLVCTGDESLGLEADIECRDIWCQLGVAEDHILPCGARDNFWDMGDAGPCGPCTEIHYDHVGNRNASSLVNEGEFELYNVKLESKC